MKQCARDPHLDCTGPKEKTGGGCRLWLYVRLQLDGGHGECWSWKYGVLRAGRENGQGVICGVRVYMGGTGAIFSRDGVSRKIR